MANPKRPKDANQRAKLIVDTATGEIKNSPIQPKNEGQRKGGIKGGKARAKNLSAKQRSNIAKKAASKRWGISNQI